jgi:lysophospholipase L1-like esterase
MMVWSPLLAVAMVIATGCAPRIDLDTLAIPRHSATMPVPRMDDWWQERQARFNDEARRGSIDLVFLGDSITQGWETNGGAAWQRAYGQWRTVNFGISGDRTQHVIWRIENGNFENIEPRAVVLMIGTNNSKDNTPKEIADGVMAIVQRINDLAPRTKVLILAIFPRGMHPDDMRRRTNAQATRQFRRIADGQRIFFADIGDAFLEKDGTISQSVMPDYLHLSPEGYDRWAEALAPHLAPLMAE